MPLARAKQVTRRHDTMRGAAPRSPSFASALTEALSICPEQPITVTLAR